MSRENVEIVRRSFDAWNEWDVEAIRSLYADDVVVEKDHGVRQDLRGRRPNPALGCGDTGDMGRAALGLRTHF